MLGPFKPGQRPSARDLNQAHQQAGRTEWFRPAEGGAFVGPYGQFPYSPLPPFVAELTSSPYEGGSGSGSGSGEAESGSGSGSGSGCQVGYGFVQVGPDDCGEWQEVANGAYGDGVELPLYEINGVRVPLITNGHRTRVVVYPSGLNWFYFDGRGFPTIDDGSGSGSGSGTNQCDQDTVVTFNECDPVTGERSETTITFPFPVRICRTPAGSGG